MTEVFWEKSEQKQVHVLKRELKAGYRVCAMKARRHTVSSVLCGILLIGCYAGVKCAQTTWGKTVSHVASGVVGGLVGYHVCRWGACRQKQKEYRAKLRQVLRQGRDHSYL